MLKRTKSANQSVIEDATDENNTSVTLAGPSQPDEDDYGYVSQEASAFYNKMMEKYSKLPDEPKFPTSKKTVSSNLAGTKDRVRAALEREREEAMMPHRRKRKQKEEEVQEELEDEPVKEEKPKAKPRNNGPPPMNFNGKSIKNCVLFYLKNQNKRKTITIICGSFFPTIGGLSLIIVVSRGFSL